jgi:hypothetical protein
MRQKLLEEFTIDFYFERSTTKASYVEKEGYLIKHALSDYMNRHPDEQFWSDIISEVCDLHNTRYVTRLNNIPLNITRKNFGSIIDALHEKQPGKWKSYYPIPARFLERNAPEGMFKFDLNERALLDISRHSRYLGTRARFIHGTELR